MKTERYGASRIAYELWCLQEDHRAAGLPVQGLSTLIAELRVRHPRLKDVAIDQGVDLFLARLFEEHQQRLAHHRRWVTHWSRSSCAKRSEEAF